MALFELFGTLSSRFGLGFTVRVDLCWGHFDLYCSIEMIYDSSWMFYENFGGLKSELITKLLSL